MEDSQLEKNKILQRAQWHDVKFLLRRILDIEPNKIFVEFNDDVNWYGWFVEFRTNVDMAEIKRNIWGVSVLGDRFCFIGVYNGR